MAVIGRQRALVVIEIGRGLDRKGKSAVSRGRCAVICTVPILYTTMQFLFSAGIFLGDFFCRAVRNGTCDKPSFEMDMLKMQSALRTGAAIVAPVPGITLEIASL